MRYNTNKDFNTYIRSLVKQGWRYEAGGRHCKLITPKGDRTVVVSFSPSDHRAMLNFKRDVRQAQEVSGQRTTR